MSHKQGEKAVRTLEAKDYTFFIKEVGNSLFLSYKPETAKIGGYSALRAQEVIKEFKKKFKLECVSVGGLGPSQVAFKKTVQFWEFSPVPDEAIMLQIKSEIEALLRRDIIVNNLLN